MRLVIKFPSATDPKHAAEVVADNIRAVQDVMVGEIRPGVRFDAHFATSDNRLEDGWWKLEE